MKEENKLLWQFAYLLKGIRKRKKMTQKQVADKSDLHVNYIAKLETGLTNPSYLCLHALAKALDCYVDDLIVERKYE